MNVDEVLEFWRPVGEAKRGPHREDRVVLERHRHSLVLKRAPEPWFGNIRSAKVFFLTLNPGHGPNDAQDKPRTRAKFNSFIYKMLRGEASQDDYFRAATPDALNWLKRTYGGFWQKDDFFDKICNLRLLAYPSPDSSGFKDTILNELPSSQIMSDFVHSYLLPRAKQGQLALLVLRSPTLWGFDEVGYDKNSRGFFLSRPGIRNVSISPSSRVGHIVEKFIS